MLITNVKMTGIVHVLTFTFLNFALEPVSKSTERSRHLHPASWPLWDGERKSAS